MEFGFRIATVSGIPVCLSQDGLLLELNTVSQSSGFCISRAKTSRIQDSTSKNFPDPDGIRISLHGSFGELMILFGGRTMSVTMSVVPAGAITTFMCSC